jgi:hypothetical protein
VLIKKKQNIEVLWVQNSTEVAELRKINDPGHYINVMMYYFVFPFFVL